MKITFICVGPIRKPCIKEGFAEYLKRIRRHLGAEVVEVKEGPYSGKAGALSLKREGERIIKRLKRDDYAVVLGERGKNFTSENFSLFIKGQMDAGRKNLCFVVGGPFGLHPSVVERADAVISLSPMTLPHELATLVLAEQVYRALTIIKGEPYSH